MTAHEKLLTKLASQQSAEHSLSAYAVSAQNLDDLRKQGIISLKARTLNLLPKDTIKALVRILRTPEANAAYEQVWQDSEELHTRTKTANDYDCSTAWPYLVRRGRHGKSHCPRL